MIVNNVAPTLEPIANTTIDEGALLSLSNLGVFSDPGFTDPDYIGQGQPSAESFTT